MEAKTVYWMVHNTLRGPANKMHSQNEAIAEAHRLAAQYPSEIIFVLQAVMAFTTEAPKIKQIEITKR